MGVIAALLVAGGQLSTLSVPLWVKVACGADADPRHGDGRVADRHDVGRRIFRLRQIDAFASQSASTAVILGAS